MGPAGTEGVFRYHRSSSVSLSVLPAAELLQWSFELVPREVLSDGHL